MRGDYGYDAPMVPLLLGAAAVVLVAGGLLTSTVGMLVGGLSLSASTASFVFTTRRGKFSLWRGLLARLALRGDERVLDMGCGRGAVLLSAARELPDGKAVGVDLWRTVDQSGNSEETTLGNARLEGVADRVELHTADITALPFEADSFDVVLSSLAIHNIKGGGDREKAISEAVRVLRPGGRLVVADIKAVRRYAEHLRTLGMAEVATTGLGWRGWFGGPWMAMSVVTAVKPRGAGSPPPPAPPRG